jgi:hypothetical protein
MANAVNLASTKLVMGLSFLAETRQLPTPASSEAPVGPLKEITTEVLMIDEV